MFAVHFVSINSGLTAPSHNFGVKPKRETCRSAALLLDCDQTTAESLEA
jgi:hypothetical protein